MQSLYIILFVLAFIYGIYLVYRFEKAKIFHLKVIKVCNNKINEALLNNDKKKLDFFLRARSDYKMINYLFSFKALKLHNWFSKEFMNYINHKPKNTPKEAKVNSYRNTNQEEFFIDIIMSYNYCGSL